VIVSLAIEDYQAIETATFKLGKFTVVTGPTGSGKSAVIRALKLAVFNQRGASYIRHGQRSCQVTLVDDAGLGLVLARGKGQDALVLDVYGEQRKYTKLGGAMPEEVAELLALDPDLNFAGQFDRPYLLDSSGAVIARILGRLTNVDLVYEAARKGYARKLGIASELTRARVTVQKLAGQVQQYAQLPAQRAACARAEAALARAQAVQQRADRLDALLAAALECHMAADAARTTVQGVQPPALDTLDALHEKHARLDWLAYELSDAEAEIVHRNFELSTLAGQEQAAHSAIHRELVDAGTCPTCGQEVTA
jgi:exonuclease SbcC